MSLFKNYTKGKMDLVYSKDQLKRIYPIFEGTAPEQTITADILPENLKMRQLLIFNSEMERASNITMDAVQKLLKHPDQAALYLFYFSQYGGSKTQFLRIIEAEIEGLNPQCVVVYFEDLTKINPEFLFNALLGQIFAKMNYNQDLAKNRARYAEFFIGLNKIVGEIHNAFKKSSNLKNAEEILSNLRRTKNIDTRDKIEELEEILFSSLLVDPLEIFDLIVKLMQYCSQFQFTFLFLLDEVDLWLDDAGPDLQFSPQFNQKTTLMKNFLELPTKNIPCIFLFACTDRVNLLFQTKYAQFSAISPAANRLIRIYNSAEKILEPGNYGESIQEALVRISILHNYYHNQEIDQIFFDETTKVLEKKYQTLSRRICNAKIIAHLRNYGLLQNPLKHGLENWEIYTQKYGQYLEDNLQSLCKRLNIKFHREQVLIDSEQKRTQDKIDGYFEIPTILGPYQRLFAEIKLAKQFKGEKARQALQWLQIHPNDPIVLVIFSPTSLEEIRKEIIQYMEKENFELSLMNKISFLHIQNPYAFVAINHMEHINSNPADFDRFLDALAEWLDFFGNFTEGYLKIINQLGFDNNIPRSTPPSIMKNRDDSIASGKEQEDCSFPPVPSPPSGPEVILSLEAKTCQMLLAHMYTGRIFNKTGKMYKATVQNFIQEKGLGITDLEKLFEFMKKQGLILSITPKMVGFEPRLNEFDSLEKMNQFVVGLLQSAGPSKVGGLKQFL